MGCGGSKSSYLYTVETHNPGLAAENAALQARLDELESNAPCKAQPTQDEQAQQRMTLAEPKLSVVSNPSRFQIEISAYVERSLISQVEKRLGDNVNAVCQEWNRPEAPTVEGLLHAIRDRLILQAAVKGFSSGRRASFTK